MTPHRGARRAPRGRDRLPQLIQVLAACALGVIYLVLASRQPLSFNAYAAQDDQGMAVLGAHLLDGDWLGPYTPLTLAKGPGFAFFMAGSHLFGVPLHIALALVYLAACVALLVVVRRIAVAGAWMPLVLFAVVLFEPALVPNRVIRDSVYHSLVLFAFAGALALFATEGRLWSRLPLALFAGASIGLAWITREEGVWLVPGLVLLAGTWLLGMLRRRRVGVAIGLLAALVLAALAPALAVSAMNRHVYGVFEVTDFHGGGYAVAMSQLDSIDAGPEIARVPVSRQAMVAAYDVSPAFREMRPFLEGKLGSDWAGATCAEYRQLCGEHAAGWFGWLLRDAAAQAGHYRSAREADRFFRVVAAQIEAGCREHVIACSNPPVPLLPRGAADTLPTLARSAVAAGLKSVYLPSDRPVLPSVGEVDPHAPYARLLDGMPLSPIDPADARQTGSPLGPLVLLYRVVTPALALAGLLSLAVVMANRSLRQRAGRPLLLMATAAWIFYATRIAVVALIDATAAPAIYRQYLEPAYLMLAIASVTSLAALAGALRRRSRPGSAAEIGEQ